MIEALKATKHQLIYGDEFQVSSMSQGESCVNMLGLQSRGPQTSEFVNSIYAYIMHPIWNHNQNTYISRKNKSIPEKPTNSFPSNPISRNLRTG